MQRSAISVTSLSTETARSTRTRSPAASIAAMKARRLSSAMMEGADAPGQQLIAHSLEPGGGEAPREIRGIGELEHRLWQVGIGVPMFRHHAADGGQHAPKVEEVQVAQGTGARCRELEHHEPRAGLEHAGRLPAARRQRRSRLRLRRWLRKS